MKNIIKRGINISLMFIFIVALVFPAKITNAVEKANDYEMKVGYGIEGKYRALKNVPINIEVSALEKDFNGEVEVRVPTSIPGTYDSYSKELTVNKGDKINITIPIMVPDNTNKLSVNMVENGKVVLESKAILSEGRVSEGDLFAGLLTDDATALGYLGSVNIQIPNVGKYDNKVTSVKLDPSLIAENNLNIDGLDLIIINNFNMATLKKEHYDTLNTWVNRGGTLIIGTGVNESKTAKVIDSSLIKISSNGTKNEVVNIEGENLPLILSELNVENSTITSSQGNNTLLYSVEKGKGKVLVSTFDLGTEPFISSKAAIEYFKNLLTPLSENIFNKGFQGSNYYDYESQQLIQRIPVDSVVSYKVIAAILAIYALIIGSVVYLVLKKIDKRDFMWIILPILAIGFSVIIYVTGAKTRVNDVVLNQFNIINVNELGKGSVKGIIGIGTKYKEDLTIEKPQDIVMNYITENYYYGSETTTDNKKLRVKTTYRDNDSYFTFKDSDALDMKKFEVSGKEQVIQTVDSSFNLVEGNLNGKVKNNLDNDIQRLILVAGESIWDIGEVKKGQEIDIKDLAITSSAGIASFADRMMQEYYDVRWGNKTDMYNDKYKFIRRHSQVLYSIANEISSNNGAKLIAITDMPIEYDITFNKDKISKFDTTATIQEVEVDFKDKDGNISFPEGYFKASINKIDTNVHVDEYEGYIYGNGEVIFDYSIGNDIDVTEISVKPGMDRWGNSSNMASNAFVYNYNSGQYEVISINTAAFKLSKANNYVENGVFKIKMEVRDGKGSAMIPRIVVVGREK